VLAAAVVVAGCGGNSSPYQPGHVHNPAMAPAPNGHWTMVEQFTELPNSSDRHNGAIKIAAWCDRTTGMLVYATRTRTGMIIGVPGGCDPRTGKLRPPSPSTPAVQ
jgi:hypothetical protein